MVCTSGTAAAHFHAAVIEADESGVPLIVLTADRPPELRGTGANQTIDQIKLYGDGGPVVLRGRRAEARPGQVGVLALAGLPGVGGGRRAGGRVPRSGSPSTCRCASRWCPARRPDPGPAARTGPSPWRAGRAARRGRVSARGPPRTAAPGRASGAAGALDLAWTERGVVVCGDGDYDAAPLLAVAQAAGWPVLAEPSSGARCGPNALSAYQYLLDSPSSWPRTGLT